MAAKCCCFQFIYLVCLNTYCQEKELVVDATTASAATCILTIGCLNYGYTYPGELEREKPSGILCLGAARA